MELLSGGTENAVGGGAKTAAIVGRVRVSGGAFMAAARSEGFRCVLDSSVRLGMLVIIGSLHVATTSRINWRLVVNVAVVKVVAICIAIKLSNLALVIVQVAIGPSLVSLHSPRRVLSRTVLLYCG